MKKRLIKLLLCILVCFATISLVGLAENTYNLSVIYDKQTERVMVTGYTDAEKAGKQAMLFVIKPSDEEFSLNGLTLENLSASVYNVRQTVIDSDGKFLFRYKWNETFLGGNFIYKVAVEGDNVPEINRTTTKYFISDTTRANAVVSLNNAIKNGSLSEIISAIELPDLELDAELSSELYDKIKNNIAEKYKALVPNADIADVKTAKNIFKSSFLYSATDAGELTESLLEDYILFNAFSDAKYLDEYEKYKSDVTENLNSGKYNAILDDACFFDCFKGAISVSALNNASRSGITEVLEKYKSDFEIDNLEEYSDYINLSYDDKIQFNLGLQNKYILTSEVKDAFIKRSSEFSPSAGVIIVTGPVISAPSGGGGGRGGGGTAVVVSPPSVDPSSLPKVEDIVNTSVSGKFVDMDTATWAIEAVEEFAEAGYISGIGEGKFAPDMQIKREEFLKILLNALQFEVQKSECLFEDCDKDAWYLPYVSYATQMGIVNGISENLFGIGENITRQDMCVMVYRAAAIKGIKFETEKIDSFKDKDDIAEYAFDAVDELSKSGVIKGFNGNFVPGANSTRAEAAVLLHRIYLLNK